jgi:hypothetical protein
MTRGDLARRRPDAAGRFRAQEVRAGLASLIIPVILE